MDLDATRLSELDPRIAVPTYDRGALVRSIVHIGVGGFHRAHLATYIDDLAGAGDMDWGIVGVGVLPGDRRMAEALGPQQGLYTLVARDPSGVDLRVVGSLLEVVDASEDVDRMVDLIAAAATRIVSLTVTEAGYPVDRDGVFDRASPNAAATSAFGALVAGLARRRDAGLPPVTILSCDNVIGNGDVARVSTLGVATIHQPEVHDWIDAHCTFPNSMVDRITPATTDADRAWLADEYDLDDRWPVFTEPFRQWVVEDHFAAGRPLFQDHGVIVTDDVEPYERMKLRLLNAGHSVLAYLSALAGIDRVDEAMSDATIAAYVERFMVDEAAPVLGPTPGVDQATYIQSLLARFSNPAIGDQISRLCQDGSAKVPTFLLPTVRANLDAEGDITLSALAMAGWCRYLQGRADDGTAITLASDPATEAIVAAANAAHTDPQRFLAQSAIFGMDLPANPRLIEVFTRALNHLRSQGTRATITAWLP